MPSVTAHASAKLIIAGEHSVVYRRPALAVPLPDIRVSVSVTAGVPHSGCVVHMPDIQRSGTLGVDDDPLLALLADVLHEWRIPIPDLILTVESDIPIASGMGSGAAVATALVRACARWYAREVSREEIADLVYRSEQRLHGTPSGIDNTVIAYDQPIRFCRRAPAADGRAQSPLITPLAIGAPFHLLIADTGVRSPTHLAVAGVRSRHDADSAHYEAVFDAIAACTHVAQAALARGDAPLLGMAARQNQTLLREIGVSNSQIDALVHAAERAGAYGAKLSGAGAGGVVYAVIDPSDRDDITAALRRAGATAVLATTVTPHAAE